MFGQPGFFEPREPRDWFSSNKSASAVLENNPPSQYCSPSILIGGKPGLSVGAVNVRTGHFDYFDSEKITIRPEQCYGKWGNTSTWWTTIRGAAA
jgi:hypothetical protein